MARKRTYRPHQDGDPALDMSSMIDCSFLLLIYFLSTSTLQPVESDLGMTLPTMLQGGAAKVQIDQMNITLNPEGAVVVNDEVLDTDVGNRAMPLLRDRVAQYKAAADLQGSTPIVILGADDRAKGQRFIDVMDTLAEVGISNVTLSGFEQK